MPSTDTKPEHFVTLFDNNFLPMGMALHHSLMQHAQPFHLWIVCMDELVEKHLSKISLPNVTLLPLREIENDDLKRVKASRTKGEYCWTMTPFTPQAVFEKDKSVEKVTYLDADLFFFDSPQVLLQELIDSGKHVLITEHAYALEYDRSTTSGRFCVQFMTFCNTDEAQKVMNWWQDKCIEWCYNRSEDGKFGDQKYLDIWPEKFKDEVHVSRQTHKTLAPWNVSFFAKNENGDLKPVFYHFHSFRIISSKRCQLYYGYVIGKKGFKLYKYYINAIRIMRKILLKNNIDISILPNIKEKYAILRYIKRRCHGIIRYAKI